MLLRNWSQFGAANYYQPRRAQREEINPNYVKVLEPFYAVSGSQLNKGESGPTANERSLTLAEALDVARGVGNPSITIRNR